VELSIITFSIITHVSELIRKSIQTPDVPVFASLLVLGELELLACCLPLKLQPPLFCLQVLQVLLLPLDGQVQAFKLVTALLHGGRYRQVDYSWNTAILQKNKPWLPDREKIV